MTTDRERILSEFIDAWNAGRRPDVDDFVGRADEPDRAPLASDIVAFLTCAPTPEYDDATLDAIGAEPAVVAEAVATRAPGGLWPSLLPRLRRRAALTTAQLAAGLVGALGLSVDSEPKTGDYLERMEAGELEPRGVSRRLLDGLSRLLEVPRNELEGAGGFGAPPAPALFRAEGPSAAELRDDLDVLADALAAPGGGDWDEVDELFRGGSADARGGGGAAPAAPARDEPVELHALERPAQLVGRPAAARCRLRERQVAGEQAAERAVAERRREARHRRGGRGQPVAQVGEPEVRGQDDVQVVGDLLVQARDEARVVQHAAGLEPDPRHLRAHAVLAGEGDDGVEAEGAPRGPAPDGRARHQELGGEGVRLDLGSSWRRRRRRRGRPRSRGRCGDGRTRARA